MSRLKIYIIRHAESLPRDGMVYEIAGKVPLSLKGKLQAFKLGQSIKKIGIEKFYVSPLKRTEETFRLINHGVPFELDDRLKEHAPSRIMTGKDFKEVRRQTRGNHSFIPNNGESFNQAANRFIEVLNEITKRSERVVCVVSHSLIIEAALTKIFNLPYIPKIDEASISLLEYEDGKFNLVFLNKNISLLKNIKNFIKKIWKKN